MQRCMPVSVSVVNTFYVIHAGELTVLCGFASLLPALLLAGCVTLTSCQAGAGWEACLAGLGACAGTQSVSDLSG
jgi:hypothetical protein